MLSKHLRKFIETKVNVWLV